MTEFAMAKLVSSQEALEESAAEHIRKATALREERKAMTSATAVCQMELAETAAREGIEEKRNESNCII